MQRALSPLGSIEFMFVSLSHYAVSLIGVPLALQKLEEHGLLTPNYAVVNRTVEGEEVEGFEEEEDYVVIRGRKMNKPFVEKPVDGERLPCCQLLRVWARHGSAPAYRLPGS